MSYYPVDIFDMDQISISREMNLTQSNTGVSHSTIVTLDNTGNISRLPNLSFTCQKAVSTITMINLTSGISAVIGSASGFASGAILDIYHDTAYNSASVEVSTSYNGVFRILENCVNSVQFNLSPTSAVIDVNTQWLQPSSVETTIGYVEGFNINENRTQKPNAVNPLKKFTNGYTIQSINFDFTIDRLFLNSWFEEEDPDETYRIKYQTNSTATDVESMTTYLCGVSFNGLSYNEADNEVIKEGIKGVACQRIHG